MIYSINEGIIDDIKSDIRGFKKKKNNKNHASNKSAYKQKYTIQQQIEMSHRAFELINRHYSEIKRVTKDELSKHKCGKYIGIHNSIDENDIDLTLDNLKLTTGMFIFCDLWEVDSDLRTNYGTNPDVSECYELSDILEIKLNDYFKETAPYLKFIADGDWDEFGIYIEITVSDLNREIPIKEESNITLCGLSADIFLEFIGVNINLDNETISIGEFTVDGYTGQSILKENGIELNHDNIIVERNREYKIYSEASFKKKAEITKSDDYKEMKK